MTGRTHDLASFTALSIVFVNQPLQEISLATALTALTANFIGALAPDLDQPTSSLWRRIPVGSIVGRILSPIMGGHRFISHSLLGVVIFGVLVSFILDKMGTVLLVDMSVVWWSFMIGFVSHLLMDSITRDGVPWLFPLPFNFGFPPFRFLRMKTGAFMEKMVVFPGLILFNFYLYYSNYHKFLEFLSQYLK